MWVDLLMATAGYVCNYIFLHVIGNITCMLVTSLRQGKDGVRRGKQMGYLIWYNPRLIIYAALMLKTYLMEDNLRVLSCTVEMHWMGGEAVSKKKRSCV